jgi:hypothetical protein
VVTVRFIEVVGEELYWIVGKKIEIYGGGVWLLMKK